MSASFMISNIGKYKVRNHHNTKLDKYTNEGLAREKKGRVINKSHQFFDPVNFTATHRERKDPGHEIKA